MGLYFLLAPNNLVDREKCARVLRPEHDHLRLPIHQLLAKGNRETVAVDDLLRRIDVRKQGRLLPVLLCADTELSSIVGSPDMHSPRDIFHPNHAISSQTEVIDLYVGFCGSGEAADSICIEEAAPDALAPDEQVSLIRESCRGVASCLDPQDLVDAQLGDHRRTRRREGLTILAQAELALSILTKRKDPMITAQY